MPEVYTSIIWSSHSCRSYRKGPHIWSCTHCYWQFIPSSLWWHHRWAPFSTFVR